MTSDKLARSRIAAPNNLDPCDTWAAVSGTIDFSVALRIADAISWAVDGAIVLCHWERRKTGQPKSSDGWRARTL